MKDSIYMERGRNLLFARWLLKIATVKHSQQRTDLCGSIGSSEKSGMLKPDDMEDAKLDIGDMSRGDRWKVGREK